MIHGAHTSRYHWGLVGTPKNLAIGEWQISHVYSVLRRSEPSIVHARRSLEICNQYGLGAFETAYAHAALARGHLLAEERERARRHLSEAKRLATGVSQAEDREHLLTDLAAIAAEVDN